MKWYSFLLVCLVTLANCGSDDATSTGNALSRAMGLVGIASPTAASSSASVSLGSSVDGEFAVQLFEGTPDNVKPLDELVTEMEAVRDGTAAVQAAALGNPLSITSARASCYGHSWTDNATGSNVNRPSGDLGISYATASDTDSTACVAAELNALLSGTPSLVNNFIKVQAIMIAAANASGKSLPGVGEEQDNTAIMPTITDLTISDATLSKSTDTDGNDVYTSSFSIADSDSDTGTVVIYHTPLNAGNTNFKGLFKALLPQTSTSSVQSHRGISMIYSEVDNVLTFVMKTAANRTSDNTDLFTAGGEVDFTKAAYGEDGHYMLAYFNKTTNESRVHYAWQAGSGDGAVRAFGIYIPAGTDGSLTGTGYFGFGPAISTLTNSNTPWITKMYCNWLSGLAGGASITKAQKQTLVQSAGIFGVGTNAWAFAPTNTCSKGTSWTVSSADASYLNGTHSEGVTSHSLVDAPGSSDLPAITAPTYTIP